MNMLKHEASVAGHSADSLDNAEKGIYNSTTSLAAEPSPPPSAVFPSQDRISQYSFRSSKPLLSPISPLHEGFTPNPSVLALPLASPDWQTASKTAAPSKPKSNSCRPSRWLLFSLWFNTYRKFFVLIVLLNITGIVLAATGNFSYAEGHMGALVLGNLLTAIMMRNELWFRLLYLVSIYGLRSVSIRPFLAGHACTLI